MSRALVIALVLMVAAVASSTWLMGPGRRPQETTWSAPRIHRDGGYAGSERCGDCHADQHSSWVRTFHRTMTQRATAQAVQGAFDGKRVTYAGDHARPYQEDGQFWMDVPDASAQSGRRMARVAMTVGSHRYQQYFEEVVEGSSTTLLRLPLLWHIEARTWLHVGTVFLFPDLLDSETLEWNAPAWDRHQDRWNSNCIFCHNTGPNPGEHEFTYGPPDRQRAFDSRVAELGISCEACHGPGEAHALAYERAAAGGAAPVDPQIVHPHELDKARSLELCGQCHGQRMPRDPAALLSRGPDYRPGHTLTDTVAPLFHDTPLLPGQQPPGFQPRFWNDGTPRLTAYEYQGVTRSPCFVRGEMSCMSCHSMHEGNPDGMLTASMRTDRACTQCHEEIGADVAAHTHHPEGSSGSRCVECHMPRIVYGVLGVRRSHQVEVPHPRRDGEAGRPHACTLCHLDQTLEWSARSMNALWGQNFEAPRQRADRAPLDLADGLASVLAGDPLQRAAYVTAMGRSDAAVHPRDKGFVRGALNLTIGDPYPALRWLARESLLSLETEHPLGYSDALRAWDSTDGSAASRGTMVDILRRELSTLGPAKLNPPRPDQLMNPDLTESAGMRALTGLQSASVISIGE